VATAARNYGEMKGAARPCVSVGARLCPRGEA
jgi:hypothetical protein